MGNNFFPWSFNTRKKHSSPMYMREKNRHKCASITKQYSFVQNKYIYIYISLIENYPKYIIGERAVSDRTIIKYKNKERKDVDHIYKLKHIHPNN